MNIHKLAIVVSLVLLSSCRRAPQQRTAPPVFKTSPMIDVYDDFEQPQLSLAWATDRFEDGAVVMQRNVVRGGRQAIALTVRSHDKFEAGRDGDLDTERDELREVDELDAHQGVPYETSFSLFFPADFPIVPTRLVIAQWKQVCGSETGPCSNQSPVLAFRYINGELLVTQAINGQHFTLFRQMAEYRNHWLDIRVRARFTPDASGRETVWLNGKQIVDYTGITANREDIPGGYPNPSLFFFKMGLYRDLMPQPMTVYIDEYRKRELPHDSY